MRPPRSLNQRQELFVQGIVAGKTQIAAYLAAGYASNKGSDSSANTLRRNPRVDAEITKRLAKIAKKVEDISGITAASVLKRINEVADRCMVAVPVMKFDHDLKEMVQEQAFDAETGQMVGVYEFDSAGANRSLELLGKHLKLFTEKVEHTGLEVPLAQMTPEERAARIAYLRAQVDAARS